MITKIKQIISRLVCPFFIRMNKLCYAFSKLLPTEDNLIIFESEGDFCDNAWALYQFLRKKNKYKFVWYVAHPENFKNTNDTIFVSRFKLNKVLAYYYCGRAKYNFYTHWTFKDIRPKKDQLVVDLIHGTGVKAGKGICDDYFDFGVLCGEGAIDHAVSMFCKDRSKFLTLGFARCDLLLNNVSEGVFNPLVKNYTFQKLIIWMPTYRASKVSHLSEISVDTETGLPLITSEDDLLWLNDKLDRLNILVLIKIHHLQADKPLFKKKYSNIVFVTDNDLAKKEIQLYSILGRSDSLLTDYSGVSFDYLLIDKPIGYILNDIKEYEESRGLFYNDVRPLFPGHHIYNKTDLLEYFNDVLKNNDHFRNQRNKIMTLMHVTTAPDACERICRYFGL